MSESVSSYDLITLYDPKGTLSNKFEKKKAQQDNIVLIQKRCFHYYKLMGLTFDLHSSFLFYLFDYNIQLSKLTETSCTVPINGEKFNLINLLLYKVSLCLYR